MFRTELPLVPTPQQLPLSARVLTIGSCFSDTIGVRLVEAKVQASVNPFGTVFNPLSACKLLRAAAGEETDWQQHLVEARGRWQSYDLHATLGADSPVDLLQTLQQVLRDAGVFLATADTVILTLGSAWVYRLKETDELVSNCHKMPAEKFSKELLTPDEIINAVAETHAYLRLRNPELRFVLTVSPVRHLKDTLPLNAVSKSVLRVACHYLSELLPDVSYFPAYELLLDDLRDYRFYAADMLHPSPVAEDYIWERFARTYFDADFGRFRKEWDAVQQALHHRPLYDASPEHRQFLLGTLERLEKLSNRADMRMEILEVRKRLDNLPLPKPVSVPEIALDDDEERIDVGDGSSAVLEGVTPTLLPILVPVDTTDTLDDNSVSEAETLAEAMTETFLPKKKRRSRGGAKRNKKKQAIRLAEEADSTTESGSTMAAETDILTENSAVVSPSTNADSLEATPAAVTLDPEVPLQTALERRKRSSRRNRGRNKQNTEAATVVPTDVTPSVPIEAPELVTSGDHDEVEELDSLAPITSPEEATEKTEQSTNTEQVAPSVGQRPVRTGRSASEVRAAALRKPRRPDSRIKALYATPSTPEEEPVTPSTEPTLLQSVPGPSNTVDIPADTPVITTEEITAPIQSATPTRLPVVSAIPLVRGTGASGRLSGSGQATLNTRKASTAAPAPAELPPVVATESMPVAETKELVDTNSSTSANTTPNVEPVSTDVATPVALPLAAVVKKTRTRPASKKNKPEDAPAETPISTTAKPRAKKAATKSSETAPEAPAPDVISQPATVPTTRRRKAAQKPAVVSEPPAEKPKRALRPSRRKPTASDEAADAS
ncbi:GSCFA domain-containing protein [Hymenobacter norwichensis]|uniref:GSCFA domain-containing protein n=1 Tax=Hymenobacter norwichensis TaxID=223903 RepID=UPI00041AB83C|nr:GSCFA domain-containing protein [Hymenobacter norwichensis]